MTVGERIRERRIELNMTQDELAKKTGYKSRSSVNKLEAARNLPSWKIDQMAAALECDRTYLMGWDEEETKRELLEAGERERQRYMRIMAYAERLYGAYHAASPDTQKAVRAILGITEEDPDGDR